MNNLRGGICSCVCVGRFCSCAYAGPKCAVGDSYYGGSNNVDNANANSPATLGDDTTNSNFSAN
jgi:hypothetical protein